MFRAAVVLSLASVLLAALAMISCLSVEDKREIRGMPRLAWVLLILLAPLAGSISWFIWGRPRRPGSSSWRAATGIPEPPRPRAPDDDPDFLRSLDQPRLNNEDEELLRQWEEDLKRREDEHRRRDPGTET